MCISEIHLLKPLGNAGLLLLTAIDSYWQLLASASAHARAGSSGGTRREVVDRRGSGEPN